MSIPREKPVGFYCTSKSWGGLEMNFARLSTWFSELGYKIYFLASRDSPTWKSLEKEAIELVEVRSHAKYLSIGAAYELNGILEKLKLKVLFSSFSPDLDTLAWLKAVGGSKIRTIFIQQMQIGVEKKNVYQTWKFNALDVWVAPLPWLIKELSLKTKLKLDKVIEVPLGQDLKSFAEFEVSKNQSRKDLNLPQEKMILGMLGRLDSQKGQEFVIRASEDLLKKNADLILLIMGENTRNKAVDEEERLKGIVLELGLNDQVIFKPFQRDPRIFFAAIDLFIMATRGETFGMVTVEALASGKPILGANSGGTSELLAQGDTGILFQSQDKADFKTRLEYCIANMEALKNIALYGQKRALELYSKDVVLEKLESILH